MVRSHELVEDPHEARRVRVVGEVAGLVEDLELAARHHGVDEAAVPERDDGVAPAPDDQRRDALGEIGPVHHGDDLAAPVDARAEGAQDHHAGLGVGQRVEDRQDLLGVAPERGVEEPQQARRRCGWRSGSAAGPSSGISASMPGTAAMRSSGLTVRPTPPLPTSTSRSHCVRELVGELGRHPTAQRVPDHGDPLDLEHAQQVAHAVGEARPPSSRPAASRSARAPAGPGR